MILGYLLVGEIFAVGYTAFAELYNRRFDVGDVRPKRLDLALFFAAQLLWPLLVPTLVPYLVLLWRRAVQNEICLCGHRRNQHDEGTSTLCLSPPLVRAQWLVNGEGDKHVYCECPKFTVPVVKR